MKEQKSWRRFTLFCILFGYIFVYGARLSFWRFWLGWADGIILAIGAWFVWLIVADLSKFEPQETRRGGWRRRYHYHHKSKQPEDEQHGGNGTVNHPTA
jgi:hypothetical protein